MFRVHKDHHLSSDIETIARVRLAPGIVQVLDNSVKLSKSLKCIIAESFAFN